MLAKIITLLAVFAVVSAQVTLTVTTMRKTQAHPTFGNTQGISTGYVINGVEGGTLTVSPGTVITFDTAATSALHPIYITTDPAGGNQGTGEFSDGVVVGSNEAITEGYGGTNVVWTVPNTPGTYYYQCYYHRFMGGRIVVAPQTLCEKYAAALSVTETELLEIVINAVVGRLVNATDEHGRFTLPFFDGTENAIDYTAPANSAALQALVDNLVAFFGAALGCNSPAFPAYQGATDMAAVHESLPIDPVPFEAFNNAVRATLLAAGVEQADADAVHSILSGPDFKRPICNEAGCNSSICDFYTNALSLTNNQALVETVVTGTVGKIVEASSPILKYFDGSISEQPINYTAGGAPLDNLVAKLVSFFKNPLGCTDNSIADDPSPGDFNAIHQNLMITASEAAFFNSAVVDVLNGAGATAKDQAIVLSVLQSLDSQVIFQGSAPPPPTLAGTFAASVSPKTSDHPFTTGFPSGFALNDDPANGQTIDLEVGLNYQFSNSAGCIHPLYITTSAVGAGEGEVAVGVDSSDYSQTCSNTNPFTITVTQQLLDAQTAGTTYYYQCRVHASMGGMIRICPVGGCGSTPPPTTAPPTPTTNTPTPTPTPGPNSPAARAAVSFVSLIAIVVAIVF